MKKILIFNDTTTIGGAEILLIEMLKHLSVELCHVTLLIPYPTQDKTLVDALPSNIELQYLYKKKPSSLQRQIAINSMVFLPRIYSRYLGISLQGYDFVVCFKDSFYSIPFSRFGGKKFLWIHTQPYDRVISKKNVREFVSSILNRIQLRKLYKSFRRYDKILCVSPTCKSEFIRIAENGCERPNIELMFNALNLSHIEEKANEETDIRDDEVMTFVVVHRFSPEKRIDRIITISIRLLSEGYKFRVFVLGQGSEFERIRQMVKDNGLENTVLLMGYLKNPYPYIKASDWLVCCSSRESFSLVLLEAINLDTPIITTNCGGPVDVVDGGKYGILTENSTDSLYSAMKSVLDDPIQRNVYLSRKEECLQRFDYEEWMSKLNRMFGL